MATPTLRREAWEVAVASQAAGWIAPARLVVQLRGTLGSTQGNLADLEKELVRALPAT